MNKSKAYELIPCFSGKIVILLRQIGRDWNAEISKDLSFVYSIKESFSFNQRCNRTVVYSGREAKNILGIIGRNREINTDVIASTPYGMSGIGKAICVVISRSERLKK